MDTKQRDIPIVEDDQGEGWVDPIEAMENLEDTLQREQWKLDERLREKSLKWCNVMLDMTKNEYRETALDTAILLMRALDVIRDIIRDRELNWIRKENHG